MSERARSSEPGSAEARYVVEHGGWSAVGWSGDDPTPEQAMDALAGLSRMTPQEYRLCMDGLRRSGEEGLARLQEAESGVAPTNPELTET